MPPQPPPDLYQIIAEAWQSNMPWEYCLRADVGQLITTLARNKGTTREFVLFLILPAISSLVSADTKVQVEDGWEECLNLGTIILADPGFGKSPAHGIAIRPLKDKIDTFTGTGLVSHLVQNQKALISPDEGDRFVQVCTSKHATSDRSLINQLLDGVAAKTARSVGGSSTKVTYAQLPECAIGIAILTWTKTFLKEQISSMNKEDGLMDRFLLVCPKPENLVSHDRKPAKEDWQKLPENLQDLSTIYEKVGAFHDVDKRTYTFSAEAAELLETDRDEQTRLQINLVNQILVGSTCSPSSKSRAAFKSKKLLPKLACLLHIAEQAYDQCVTTEGTDWSLVIDIDTTKRAMKLMQYCIEQRQILLKAVKEETTDNKRKEISEKEVIQNLMMQPGPYINPRKSSKGFSSNYGFTGEKVIPFLKKMDDEKLGKYLEGEGNRGFIKEYPLEKDYLAPYNLTPKKYENALRTKQQVKSQQLSDKQEKFFDKNGGLQMKRKLFNDSEEEIEKSEEEAEELEAAPAIKHVTVNLHDKVHNTRKTTKISNPLKKPKTK